MACEEAIKAEVFLHFRGGGVVVYTFVKRESRETNQKKTHRLLCYSFNVYYVSYCI